ncbi:hypothetical protein HDV05_005326 [Chytridiales sp. JEL 0842]|nr:hypothetical protein HDV05_005326 [Chytridiales sp. JEL 0842]
MSDSDSDDDVFNLSRRMQKRAPIPIADLKSSNNNRNKKSRISSPIDAESEEPETFIVKPIIIDSSDSSSSNSPPAVKAEEAEKVVIRVTVTLDRNQPPQTLKFKTLPSQLFREIVKDLSAKFGLPTELMVLCYKHTVLSHLATPASLRNIQQSKRLDLGVYSQQTYAELQQEEEARREELLKAQDAPEPTEPNLESAADDAGKKILVKLRDNTGVIKIKILKTSLIQSLIDIISDQRRVLASQVQLEFDHEKLNPTATIDECEIEDGCLVDVKYK